MTRPSTKRLSVAKIQSMLVRRLRIGREVSRVELARQLNLAPSTVGLYVDGLIADGYLREGCKAKRASGRPPTILELNPQAGRFIGIDFEAQTLRAIAVDFSQTTLDEREYAILATDGVDEVLAKIEQAIREIGGKGRRLLGVGIAVPGVVDPKRGIGLHYRHIRDWCDVPLLQWIAERVRRPVYVENNIRAMALAEQWFGQGRRLENFLCLGIRSGIGAGVVVDRRLLGGAQNLAGEIGGWRCHNGNTLEAEASVAAVLSRLGEQARAGGATSLPVKHGRVALADVLQAARDGDALTLDVLQQASVAVGAAIAQFSLLLNPERVIVAGPLSELGDIFLQPIRDAAAEFLSLPFETMPTIVASQLGAYAGAIGAAALAVHEWRPVLDPTER
jgi:predicted NBD/HSP70 family sugar kinase